MNADTNAIVNLVTEEARIGQYLYRVLKPFIGSQMYLIDQDDARRLEFCFPNGTIDLQFVPADKDVKMTVNVTPDSFTAYTNSSIELFVTAGELAKNLYSICKLVFTDQFGAEFNPFEKYKAARKAAGKE